MSRKTIYSILSVLAIGALIGMFSILKSCKPETRLANNNEDLSGYVGSRSCIECHERFYELWSPSHHGKAMQPIEDVVKAAQLIPQTEAIQVGANWFTVELRNNKMYMSERAEKDSEEIIKTYECNWALGGRNIFYFLTPFEGGRLQTMPLAYDLNRKEWYSNPQSAVRHFVGMNLTDEEIDWTHSLYTFNTTCHSCHVSQLNKNYDAASDTYHTTWKEPGINCETCHGPSEEHVAIYRKAAKTGEEPSDLGLISTKVFSKEQHNASCAPCHAKMTSLTNSYPPGEPFFQHFNITTLEDPDFYVDGRDLGENYTMTTWYQNDCTVEGDMHCITCHTSSGRFRFKDEPINSCASCHTKNADNIVKHSHHPAEAGVTCIDCHMPTTEFARMTRSDHSMRPPMPAASIEFESPNACIICHDDQTNEWANEHVVKWKGDYQDETLERSRLLQQARNQDYGNIKEMLKLIENTSTNFVYRTSMLRMLMYSRAEGLEATLLKVANDQHPLIRATANESLQTYASDGAKKALLAGAQDSVRVVRISASIALSRFPQDAFTAEEYQIVEKNYAEYKEYLTASPDSWSSHYNLGNFYQGLGMYHEATSAFDKASELEQEIVTPLVNASMSLSMVGDNAGAEERLKKAIAIEPGNAAANFNYGLLLGQLQRFEEAKNHLRTAIENDTTLAAAAYNMAVISAQTSLDEALLYSKKAAKAAPDMPRYAYTYAFYLNESGQLSEAISTLKELVSMYADYIDGHLFLATIYENQKEYKKAIKVYETVLNLSNLPDQYKANIQMKANQLKEKL